MRSKNAGFRGWGGRGWCFRKAPRMQGGPGRPRPSQPRARLPPPGAPGKARHERDNGKPASRGSTKKSRAHRHVVWHRPGLLCSCCAQEE
jgi:hypothetical protein